jgi:hypothetical protein
VAKNRPRKGITPPGRVARPAGDLERLEAKLTVLRERFDKKDPRFRESGHGFVFAEKLSESDVRRVESEAELVLPAEYRAFLLRFGDGEVGPARYRRLRDGLHPTSGQPFPLTTPFLGCCSPAHQRLSEKEKWKAFHGLSREWDLIPKDHGVLSLCDYGCSMYGVLITNGPFCGKVWMLSGDAAYYGPFGGAEALHDENTPSEWIPGESPRDYSFFEWYESWLDGWLNTAGLVNR